MRRRDAEFAARRFCPGVVVRKEPRVEEAEPRVVLSIVINPDKSIGLTGPLHDMVATLGLLEVAKQIAIRANADSQRKVVPVSVPLPGLHRV